MAGYVLVIIANDKLSKVRPLFRASETSLVSLNDNTSMLYVSNGGHLRDRTLFQGYGIDHETGSMIFSGAVGEYLPQPSQPIEGSYFTARYDQHSVTCGADLFGFVPMVWFSEPWLFAVSDSFHTLVEIRKYLGLSLSLNLTTVKARSWLNSMAFQQLGTETFAQEISYATPGTKFTYNIQTGLLEETPCQLKALYTSTFESHEEAITLSAQRMVRTIKTYAEAKGIVSLALSGGLDSRVCLAAALRADIGEALFVSSTDNGSVDFALASELSLDFNFPLNRASSDLAGETVRNDVFASWASASMGLYDTLYMPTNFSSHERPVFMIGGQGAEMSKGNYGWRALDAIPMPMEALAQAEATLRRIGVDPEDNWGSEWHYLAHRGALHSGRAILSTDYVSRPAAQIPLIGLSRSSLNELPAPQRSEPNIIFDCLLKLNPALARQPFDSRAKSQPEGIIQDRLGQIGGRMKIDSLEPYEVVGNPRASKNILGSHIDIAQNAGFTGPISARRISPIAERVVSECGHLLSSEVLECFESIDKMNENRMSGSGRESGVMGQLIAISTILT